MKTTYSFNIWNHILQDGNSKFLAFYVEKFQPFLTVTKLFNWQIVADIYWSIFLQWKGRLAVFLPSLPILRAQHKSQRLTEYMDSLGSETAFTLYKLTVNGCICGKWVLNFKKKKTQDKKPAPVCSWAEASCNTSAAPLIMALFRYYTVWARARAMWTANTELRRKYSHWGAQINHVSEMRWRYRTGCL